ncbi:Glycosyltransferase [Azospirillum argentinense]|uniref:Uncharacterized protein n=1 Tax=Azospirillum argentinense TaxID=2970906 RepID=A0A5B0KUS7_9PROT|nr:Glycosyltransferase [Azospirillum argentinense]
MKRYTLAPTLTLPRSWRTFGPPAASAQTFGLRESWAGEGMTFAWWKTPSPAQRGREGARGVSRGKGGGTA